jgi:hypothetical protein
MSKSNKERPYSTKRFTKNPDQDSIELSAEPEFQRHRPSAQWRLSRSDRFLATSLGKFALVVRRIIGVSWVPRSI